MSSKAMPPFGDMLNAGIQTIKQLCSRSNGITPNAFEKKYLENLGLTQHDIDIIIISNIVDAAQDEDEDEDESDE